MIDPLADDTAYDIEQERLDAAFARGEPEWTVTLTVHAATRDEAETVARRLRNLKIDGEVRMVPRVYA